MINLAHQALLVFEKQIKPLMENMSYGEFKEFTIPLQQFFLEIEREQLNKIKKLEIE